MASILFRHECLKHECPGAHIVERSLMDQKGYVVMLTVYSSLIIHGNVMVRIFSAPEVVILTSVTVI